MVTSQHWLTVSDAQTIEAWDQVGGMTPLPAPQQPSLAGNGVIDLSLSLSLSLCVSNTA